MTTKLDRFTLKAREEPQTRFNALMGILSDPEGLRESFGRQDGRKAPGVDGVKKEDYAEGVQARLEDLSARIRRLGYRPEPVRRTYIPKGDGRYRPLGVPKCWSISFTCRFNLRERRNVGRETEWVFRRSEAVI